MRDLGIIASCAAAIMKHDFAVITVGLGKSDGADGFLELVSHFPRFCRLHVTDLETEISRSLICSHSLSRHFVLLRARAQQFCRIMLKRGCHLTPAVNLAS